MLEALARARAIRRFSPISRPELPVRRGAPRKRIRNVNRQRAIYAGLTACVTAAL
jgi:hypothetical protein